MSDSINHPSHYNQGKMEVWEAIEGLGLGFHAGNVLKYIARAPFKGTELDDLKKAKVYIQRMIELKEGESNA